MNAFNKLLIVIALATVVLASLIEAVILACKERYDWKALGVSLFDMVARHVILIVLPLSIATPVLRFAAAHRLTSIALDSWMAIALLFIGQEFCYYWYHRASHRMRWFWRITRCITRPTSLTSQPLTVQACWTT
jgi:sterol desaturase/sphingolipid hydroxylase (fatty acid hydroxylase superfamily)